MPNLANKTADVNVVAKLFQELDIGDEVFREPARLVEFEHWIGHIPFAYWLTKVLTPNVFVELGTHRGNSYFAFCEAISKLPEVGSSYAVDTWMGDIHMGQESDLYEEVLQYNQVYSSFSTLINSTFNDARNIFSDKSIDLLHIDGCHTYDAVKEDFNNWLPAISDRGIVIFHDTAVHKENFGVWRFFKELQESYPSFNFTHSYGLGVVSVGTEPPEPLLKLMKLPPEQAYAAKKLFAGLGDKILVQYKSQREIERLGAAIASAESEARGYAAQLSIAQKEVVPLRVDLQSAIEELKGLRAKAIADASYNREQMNVLRRTLKAEAESAATAKHNLNIALAQLEAARGDNHNLQSQFTAITGSSVWRATWPLRKVGQMLPASLRTAGRRSAKIGWWTITLQLPSKLRSSRPIEGGLLEALTPEQIDESPRPLTTDRPNLNSRFQLPDLTDCKTYLPKARIAVVVHLYFDNLWTEIETRLRFIDEPFDLYLSVSEKTDTDLLDRIIKTFPATKIHYYPNIGRDILPFVHLAACGVLNRYSYVCKLHTKQSVHLEDGDQWRQRLYDGVLRDKDHVKTVIANFDHDADLGIVVADGEVYGDNPDHWRNNRSRIVELGGRIGINEIKDSDRFPGGSVYWIRPFLLRTLSALNLQASDFEEEPITVDASSAHAVERLVGMVCEDAGMRIAPASSLQQQFRSIDRPSRERTQVLAYYLPQFHPTAENDEWWGKGFTEWANVTRARPQFKNHRQPRLPADLGFYDLRVPQVREAQADMALEYGVDGFCYYYYWFDGKGVLRNPLEEMLSSNKPQLPFMICWANEPWTRNWDGGNREVLMPQTYADGWASDFAVDIAPIMKDERYIKVAGRPALFIYRVMHIPDLPGAIDTIRSVLKSEGVGEVHIAGGWVGFGDDEPMPENPRELGLDAFFGFPPHRIWANCVNETLEDVNVEFSGYVFSYESLIDAWTKATGDLKYPFHNAAMMGWDNTARRQTSGNVFHGATPAKFRRLLRGIIKNALFAEQQNSLVVINAWNEWAEGTYLEPDRDFGHGWLEAVRSARAGLLD